MIKVSSPSSSARLRWARANSIALVGRPVALENRVNKLVAERSADLLNTDTLYLTTSVDVVRELFILGAGISLVGLFVALLMRGGRASELDLGF